MTNAQMLTILAAIYTAALLVVMDEKGFLMAMVAIWVIFLAWDYWKAKKS